MNPCLIAIMGPTGSGKSDLAEALADRIGAVLINADAFQVYRGLDIGTNKPSDRDRYRLLDIKDPWEGIGVGEYVRLASEAACEAVEAGHSAIVVGGTGLYIRALFEEWKDLAEAPTEGERKRVQQLESSLGADGLVRELLARDPGAASRVDIKNPLRVRRALERLVTTQRIHFRLPKVPHLKFGLQLPRPELRQRLSERVTTMLASGWIEEVQRLRGLGVTEDAPAMRAIGYSYILRHLEGRMSTVDLIRSIVTDTRQYAKRQETWMRSEPRLEPVVMGEGMSEALSFVLTKLAWREVGRNQVVDGKSNQSSGYVPESSA